MRKAIPQSVREDQLNNLLKPTPFTFVRWTDGFKNNKSRVTIHCPSHGEWSTCFNNIIVGRRCNSCAKQSRLHAEPDVIATIKTLLPDTQTVVGFLNGYKNNMSKATVECSKHGEWSASALHLIHSKSGCPKCATEAVRLKRVTPKEITVSRLKDKATSTGYVFSKIIGEYRNSRSKIEMICKIHGGWVTDINTVNTGKHGCPSCSISGYKENLQGYLYFLKSTNGNHFKVGITNDIKRRIVELRRNTPFEFKVYDVITNEGSVIKQLEGAFHSQFESANMKGFNGSTEWFEWSEDVTQWLELLRY